MIALSTASYGWGNKGHMMVAAVAYDKLTPATRTRVDTLVRLNPDIDSFFDRIPASASPALTKKMLFMLAATWPDMIKSNPDYTTDGTHGGNRPPADTNLATQNIGYADLFRHKYWHFVDKPFGTGTIPIPTPNAKDRIEEFITTLGSDRSDDVKSYDLCWLLHLVGDVHQPLHCLTRITEDDMDGDDGGNSVRLKPSGKLHSFWAGVVGSGNAPSTAISAVASLPTASPSQVNQLDVQEWLDEAFNLRNSVYKNPPIKNNTGPFKLTATYKANALGIAKARIALAGARLAKILNEKLGSG
jgi:hypothetical protein